MVEILRNKWCEDLEDILQCPICMICPANVSIFQCTEGHHICQVCMFHLPQCPTCGNKWSQYKNRLAENLCLKFDDIKSSLIDPEAEINKLLILDKLCAATQTENVEDTAAAVPSPVKQQFEGHSGPYPCCVGTCEAKMSFEPLMEHIKSTHSLHYLELPLGNGLLFEFSWIFDYTNEMVFDRVFRINDVGTFILKLSTDKCGDFSGFITMLHSGFVSKQFSYQLMIGNGADQIGQTYIGNVNSCRAPATIFKEKCLRVKNEDMRKMYENPGRLKCTLRLAKKLQLDEALLPTLNGQNKKRSKNRNKNAKITTAHIQSAVMPGA